MTSFDKDSECGIPPFSLLSMVKRSNNFEKWTKPNHKGHVPPSPLGLPLIGSLRHLERGWTSSLQQYGEGTNTWRKSKTNSFNKFNKFQIAGMPRRIDSTNTCHVWRLDGPHAFWLQNSGFKVSVPTRTYNLTCNHRQQILSSTKGYSGRWNDKTLVWFDELVTDVRTGRVLPLDTFTLLHCHQDGMVSKKEMSVSCWSLTTAALTGLPGSNSEAVLQLSWEAMVQVGGGSEQGRGDDIWHPHELLKVLKSGIWVRGVEIADWIWCAPLNWLLEQDGKNSKWDNELAVDAWLDPEFADHSAEGNWHPSSTQKWFPKYVMYYRKPAIGALRLDWCTETRLVHWDSIRTSRLPWHRTQTSSARPISQWNSLKNFPWNSWFRSLFYFV